jgi:hypothetical protein
MRIDAELDPIHSERLETLLERLKRPLPEVLGVAIDAAYGELAPEGQQEDSALFAALESIGFIGCIEDDSALSATYKTRIDFSAKSGVKP